jgi:hypothetical protein
MHHYFSLCSHPFVKGPWIRRLPLQVLLHFLSKASGLFGDIPRGKYDHDGKLLQRFVTERELSSSMLSDVNAVTWEHLKEMMEVYKVSVSESNLSLG